MARVYAPIPAEAERIGKALLDAAFEVHSVLGPGFLERIYEEALCYELARRSVPFERQKSWCPTKTCGLRDNGWTFWSGVW